MRSIPVFFLLLFGISLSAETSYWDDELVRSYVHHSELQRRWAFSFMAPHLRGAKGNERILDIGCGDGKITADMAKFVPRGTVIGLDVSLYMLDWARKQYHSVEYPNLLFQEGSFLRINHSERFDWIVSFCAFQHCRDQEGALREISRVLKPGGKLLILVPAMNNQAWNQAREKIQALPKWAAYWRSFPPRKFHDPQEYIDLLRAANFHVVKVEAVQTMDPFVDREEILDWLEGTFAPVVPKDDAREFYNEWIEAYLQLDPYSMDQDGVIFARLGIIEIEATCF